MVDFYCWEFSEGFQKNKALIKFLSQEGVKQLLQKTENTYMADNNKLMPEVDEELWYVIEEKNNSIDLSDKGIAALSTNTSDEDFFVLPDLGVKIGDIDASQETTEKKSWIKREIIQRL